MEEILYYNALYDCYKKLLTKKQQDYFEGYYFYNLSFGELAENEGVSRNAIFKQVKDTCKKLEEYEEKMHICAIKKELSSLEQNVKEEKVRERITKIIEELD